MKQTFILGITGRRTDPDPRQIVRIEDALHKGQDRIVEVHHGDCRGADAIVHDIARDLLIPVVVHPPKDPKDRAFRNGEQVRVLPEKPYADRNLDIVLASDVLFALPEGPEDKHPRSGTWMTIRMARERRVPTWIIYPDGTISRPQKFLL